MQTHITELGTGISPAPEFAKKGLAEFSVNVGTKCGHDCLYCSTGSILRMHKSFKEADESPFGLGYAIVDPSTPERVAADAKKIKNRGLIQLCTTVDAWAPEAQESNIGRRCLEAILAQPDWRVRILTKNAAVAEDFDLIEKYRDRVIIGLSLTAIPSRQDLTSIIEPNASTIKERMAALVKANRRGLRTYAMLCPLMPGIASSPADIDELVQFSVSHGAEEIFAEPVNARGSGLIHVEDALRGASRAAEADAINEIRRHAAWSDYAVQLLKTVRGSVRRNPSVKLLRYLLYTASLTAEHQDWVAAHPEGVRFLRKSEDAVN
jgi:DNA repair photolyase